MVFVTQFFVRIVSGVVQISSWAHPPAASQVGFVPVTGPGLAMSMDDAKALADLLLAQIEQVKALESQSKNPN